MDLLFKALFNEESDPIIRRCIALRQAPDVIIVIEPELFAAYLVHFSKLLPGFMKKILAAAAAPNELHDDKLLVVTGSSEQDLRDMKQGIIPEDLHAIFLRFEHAGVFLFIVQLQEKISRGCACV